MQRVSSFRRWMAPMRRNLLDKAAGGLIDLPSALERSLQTNFYVTPNLLKALLENDVRRKRPGQTPKM